MSDVERCASTSSSTVVVVQWGFWGSNGSNQGQQQAAGVEAQWSPTIMLHRLHNYQLINLIFKAQAWVNKTNMK